MFKALKKLFVIAVTVLALAFPVYAIDKDFDREAVGSPEYYFSQFVPDEWSNDLAKEYVNLEASVLHIRTIGSAITHYPVYNKETMKWDFKEATGMFGMSGSGFLVEGGYVITAAHVVEPYGGTVQEAEHFYFSGFGPTVKILQRVILIGDGCTASIIYVDNESDVALLKLDGPWPTAKPLPYEMVWTGGNRTAYPLQAGDAVITLVRQRDEDMSQSWTYEARFGKVKAGVPVVPEGNPVWSAAFFSLNDIALDLTIYPGDSGSPLFGLQDGKPVLIGIVRAMSWNPRTGEVIAYAARLDTIKQIIDGELGR